MLNHNLRIPRWLGPIAGAMIGAIMAIRGANREGIAISIEWILMGSLIGAAAGSILWLVDSRDKPGSEQPGEKGTTFSRAIAVIQILAFWVPIAGTCVCIFGLVSNWRARGWPRIICWIGVSLSLLVTIPIILLMIFMPPTH
jgi:hypothetical protein